MSIIDCSRGLKEGVTKKTPITPKTCSPLCDYLLANSFWKIVVANADTQKVLQDRIRLFFVKFIFSEKENSRIDQLFGFGPDFLSIDLKSLKIIATRYYTQK